MVRVSDADTGAVVSGQSVLVIGWRGGKAVLRRWVETDGTGAATASFKIVSTTRFSLRSPATETTEAATSAGTLTWQAVPRVKVRPRTGQRVAVKVLDARGQRVRFERRAGTGWVTVRVRRIDDEGRAVARGLPHGTYRARVSAVPGLAAVFTSRWRLR
jgi:hypothetical protein